MDSTESMINRIADKVSSKRLELFTALLRRHAIESGCPEQVFDDAVESARYELNIEEAKHDYLTQAVKTYENRGMDTLGRIVIEFCFIRTPNGPMLWPEYSEEDSLARWNFSEMVLPRPLMRYFLVSLRGSIENLDSFASESYLFEENPDQLEETKQAISDLIEAFKGPFGSGESSVNWQDVYEDARFQELALDIITKFIQKIESEGPETYLDHLNRYRQNDAAREEGNLMQRPFSTEDVKQISKALMDAERTLQDKTM